MGRGVGGEVGCGEAHNIYTGAVHLYIGDVWGYIGDAWGCIGDAWVYIGDVRGYIGDARVYIGRGLAFFVRCANSWGMSFARMDGPCEYPPDRSL